MYHITSFILGIEIWPEMRYLDFVCDSSEMWHWLRTAWMTTFNCSNKNLTNQT